MLLAGLVKASQANVRDDRAATIDFPLWIDTASPLRSIQLLCGEFGDGQMPLTTKELQLILEALQEKYGFGYSAIKEVGQLQAKLSIMLDVAHKREQAASA